MNLKKRLKKYGNTTVLRISKEEMERLKKEKIILGTWVDINITKDTKLNKLEGKR